MSSDVKNTPNQAGSEQGAGGSIPPELEAARDSLSKLPILGPAVWLYARDPLKKHTFLADIDWTLLPPVILDQCRLYTKEGVPFAFFTWAKVSDEVDQRLRGGEPRIAPHEWQGGDNLWMVDMVAPFGHLDEMFADLRKEQLAGRKISALLPDPDQGNKMTVHEWND